MKVVLVGIWVTLVALGASWFFATQTRTAEATAEAAKEKEGAPLPNQFVKTRAVSVPVIADGGVQGYVVVQFGLTVDAAAAKRASIPPEVFCIDEAFRFLYTDDKLDFHHLGKLDVPAMVRTLQDNVNKRLGENVVKNVLLQDLTYVPKQSETQ